MMICDYSLFSCILYDSFKFILNYSVQNNTSSSTITSSINVNNFDKSGNTRRRSLCFVKENDGIRLVKDGLNENFDVKVEILFILCQF